MGSMSARFRTSPTVTAEAEPSVSAPARLRGRYQRTLTSSHAPGVSALPSWAPVRGRGSGRRTPKAQRGGQKLRKKYKADQALRPGPYHRICLISPSINWYGPWSLGFSSAISISLTAVQNGKNVIRHKYLSLRPLPYRPVRIL